MVGVLKGKERVIELVSADKFSRGLTIVVRIAISQAAFEAVWAKGKKMPSGPKHGFSARAWGRYNG